MSCQDESVNPVHKALKSDVDWLKKRYSGEDLRGEMPLIQTPPNHESTVAGMDSFTPSPIGQQTVSWPVRSDGRFATSGFGLQGQRQDGAGQD